METSKWIIYLLGFAAGAQLMLTLNTTIEWHFHQTSGFFTGLSWFMLALVALGDFLLIV